MLYLFYTENGKLQLRLLQPLYINKNKSRIVNNRREVSKFEVYSKRDIEKFKK